MIKLAEYKSRLSEACVADRVAAGLSMWLGNSGLAGYGIQQLNNFLSCARRDYKEDSDKFAERISYCNSYNSEFPLGKFRLKVFCDTGGAVTVTLFGPPEVVQWEEL